MRLPFTSYAVKELVFFSLLWVGAGAALWAAHPLGAWLLPLPLAGFLFTLNFFRDPSRRVPDEPGLLVSPADGTVVEIAEVEETEFLRVPCHKIAIFLSVFDVHVNRAPCDGPVKAARYTPGRFLDARHPDCGAVNESNALHVGDVLVRQVAGLIARRIVCDVRPPDVVARGQRIGMIKFGSRTELYVPKDQVREIRVRLNEKVKGGETVVARIR